MATVGNLFINVKARTAAFSKKMKGVRATVARLAKGFGRMALKVAKFAAVLGGIAVAALIAMTKAGLASVDMVAKLARALNTGTEGIIALQHAAKLGGVSVEKMDKAIIKMFKNVGEATTGLGLAKDSLDAMGLSATDLSQMDADAMFGAIAGGLMTIQNAATRAYHANALFGKSGVELIPIMLKGAAGIREMREEADALGITFGIKQAAMVEKANDAWARIGSIWKGLTQQLAINFAPILELIARKLKDFIITSGGVAPMAEVIVLSIARMGAAAINTMNKVHSGWLTFKAAIIAGGGAILDFWGDMFDDDISKLMAKSLFRQAGELLLDAEAIVPITEIEKKIRELRKKLEGMGIDDNMELNIVGLPDLAANFKGAAENLSTAIGSMKVEGDSQSRILSQTLNIEKEHLQTSKDTLDAIRSGGVVLT
jgi:uncharacterized protein with GYD domain